MRTVFLLLATLSILLFSETPALPQLPSSAEDSRAPQVHLRMDRIRLTGVTSDVYQFDAELQLQSSVAANVEGLAFSAMRLNGDVPLFVAPLQTHLVLKQDQWTELPTLQITIYAADLPSLASLQTIVEARSAHVQGELRAALDLPLVARLFMRTLHPTVVLVLNQPVTLEQDAVNPWVAGGLALGTLAQGGVNVLRGMFGLGAVTADTAESQGILRSVVLVHTTYRVQTGASASTRSLNRLGFWVTPHSVLVPDEALEPWAYSPLQSDELASGDGVLDTTNVEITVGPASDPSRPIAEWSLLRGDFLILRHGNPEKTRLVLSPQARNVEVLARDSSANFAVLEFRQNIVGEPIPLTPCKGQRCWPTLPGGVTVIRENTGTGQAILLDLRRTQTEDALVLSRPLDDQCFGSPVLTSQGVVGMVSSERGIVPADVLRSAAGKRGSSR